MATAVLIGLAYLSGAVLGIGACSIGVLLFVDKARLWGALLLLAGLTHLVLSTWAVWVIQRSRWLF